MDLDPENIITEPNQNIFIILFLLGDTPHTHPSTQPDTTEPGSHIPFPIPLAPLWTNSADGQRT